MNRRVDGIEGPGPAPREPARRRPAPAGLAALLGAVLLAGPGAGPGWAGGPVLDVAESVVPAGETVAVTVLGEPGQYYALVASGADQGLTLGDRGLDLGPDAVVVATGRLDAAGRATVRYTPPFGPEGLAKVHLQGLTAGPAEGAVIGVTPGKVLRALSGGASAVTLPPVAGARAAEPAAPDAAGGIAGDPGSRPAVATGPVARLGEAGREASGPAITAVLAGLGLLGGGASGDVTLQVAFAGSGGSLGTASTVARSDHTHGDSGVPNVLTVAPSGGDFTSVAEALASITDASSANRYLVRVMPGVYEESALVEIPGHVHLRGSGPNVTVVTSARSGGAPSDAAATVSLLESARVSDLAVRNTGTGVYGIALYSAETTRATVVDGVVAEAIGAGGTGHYAAFWNDAAAIVRHSTLFAGGATGFGTAVNAAFGSVNIADGFPQALIERSILMGGAASNLENCNDNTGTGFGMQLLDSSPQVRHSYICGGHRGIAVLNNGHVQVQNSRVQVSSLDSAALFEISASGSISVATSGVSYFNTKLTGAGTGLRCVHTHSLGTWVPLTDGTTAATACNVPP